MGHGPMHSFLKWPNKPSQLLKVCGWQSNSKQVLPTFFMHLMQVQIVVDNLDIRKINYINLRAALSASLLLLPSEFTEVYFFLSCLIDFFGSWNLEQLKWFTITLQADLYAKICNLSYMGDVRMLFAEDKNKVVLDCCLCTLYGKCLLNSNIFMWVKHV